MLVVLILLGIAWIVLTIFSYLHDFEPDPLISCPGWIPSGTHLNIIACIRQISNENLENLQKEKADCCMM